MEGIEGAGLFTASSHAHVAFLTAHIAALITDLVVTGKTVDALVGGVVEGHIEQWRKSLDGHGALNGIGHTAVTGAAVDKSRTIDGRHLSGLLQVAAVTGMLAVLGVKGGEETVGIFAAANVGVALATGNITAIFFRGHVMAGEAADATVRSVIERHIEQVVFP